MSNKCNENFMKTSSAIESLKKKGEELLSNAHNEACKALEKQRLFLSQVTIFFTGILYSKFYNLNYTFKY